MQEEYAPQNTKGKLDNVLMSAPAVANDPSARFMCRVSGGINTIRTRERSTDVIAF